MKYKLFISDYDGTLGVAPVNDIHPETLKAINKFVEKGGIFAVCSGRETSSITRILRAHKLKGIVVSFQGAKITDIESGKILFNGGLCTEKALEVIEAVDGRGLTTLVYSDDEIFYQEKNAYIEHYERAIMLKGKVADVREELKKHNNGVCKIVWLGDDKIVNQTAKELNAVYKGVGVKFNSGAKNLLEAINPDCGKGVAVKFLADYYGVTLDQVIAVGDSTNDIDLLNGPWHGVCVGDGRDELKAVADEITVPYEQKPVKVLLEKYCL